MFYPLDSSLLGKQQYAATLCCYNKVQRFLFVDNRFFERKKKICIKGNFEE